MIVTKLSIEHIEERCHWLNHPAVYNDMNMQYPITYHETEKWFERVVCSNNRMDLVFITDENTIASMAGITNIDITNGIAEFYIIVNPSLQGKGFGLSTTTFTMNYAFMNFNIHKIYLYTNSFNEKANKLYSRLGFVLEGTLRKHKFKNGNFIDRYVYGLLKEEWSKTTHYETNIKLTF